MIVITTAFEALIVVLLYIFVAAKVFNVAPAAATPGVPELIAYQGLLTDANGNPLGGAGSVYCFRYSLWDSASGGTQVWPAGTPSNSTTTVIDGVFSDNLGRTDSLSSLDFESTSTYYLQVQVSTSSLTCATGLETLSPRQQVTSNAWSQTAQNVYGNQLRTFSGANTVQIGTGAGVIAGNQTLLSLDRANAGESVGGTCSTNGTLWYDSNLGLTLVCQGGLIQEFETTNSTLSGGISWVSTAFNRDVNSNASTSLIGTTGVGTTTIPANMLKAGSAITIQMNGLAAVKTAQNFSYWVVLGGKGLQSTAASYTANSSGGFGLECRVVIQSAGTNGVWTPGCRYTAYTTGSAAQVVFYLDGPTSTVDTTIANTVDFKAMWTTATSTASITSTVAVITVNP